MDGRNIASIGLSLRDSDLLTIDMDNDMYAESRNNECNYANLASQEDFDRFRWWNRSQICGRI